MHSIILSTTFLFGLICAGYSGYLFIYFMQSDKPAGKAVMWMIGGEFIGLSVYCSFCLLEVFRIRPDPIVSTALRWIVFSSALAASIHMSHAIRKIGDDS